MTGGFSSRILFVVERGKPDKLIPWPEKNEEVEELERKLIQDLKVIHSLTGQFTMTKECWDFYDEWYLGKYQDEQNNLPNYKFKGYFSRKATHIMKIAMCLSVSESNDLVLNKDHVESALKLVVDLEPLMFDTFTMSGKNKNAREVQGVLEYIVARKDPVAYSELFNRYRQDMEPQKFDQMLVALTKAQFLSCSMKNQMPYYETGRALRKENPQQHNNPATD